MIDKLPLHDGTLKSVRFDWIEGRVVLQIALHDAAESTLTFLGVSALNVPRQLTWGRSASINQVRMKTASAFEVEMQSGDTILISAENWTFQPLPGKN